MAANEEINNMEDILVHNSPLEYSISYLPLLKKLQDCFSNTPIMTFCYMRFYKDGHFLYLSNQEAWLKAYFENQLYNCLDHTHCYTANNQGGYYSWFDNKHDSVLIKAAELNIISGINFCNYTLDYCEVYAFCAENINNEILNFYTKHNFKIRKIINTINKNFLHFLKFEKKDMSFVNTNIKNAILKYCEKKTKEKLLILDGVSIGNKALDCLYWMCQGKSADETATILNLSKRTVEEHINNMKIKANCSNKTHLVYKIFSTCPHILDIYERNL